MKDIPKLDVQTTDEIPAAEEGKVYDIVSADEFSSAVRSFKGLRVTLKDLKGNEAVEALWLRSPVGPKSKLGSFVVVLGKDTKNWIGKRIRIISWKQGSRQIELAPPK